MVIRELKKWNIKKNNMKVAKVLAFYFGDRRYYPKTKEGTIDLFKKQIENHRIIDPGVYQDLIIVNHDKGEEDIKTFLNEYDGQDVFNGKIKIIHRPLISPDLSFGSYKYAFYLLQDKYDYWFFSEDDIMVLNNNITKKMIYYFNREPNLNLGFIAALNYNGKLGHRAYPLEDGYISKADGYAHAHGGMGLTSTKIMKKVAELVPEYLQTPNIQQINHPQIQIPENLYKGEHGYEIGFTNDFVKAGFNLKPFESNDYFLHIRENTTL